jgi:KDO2-lipid IV(A) lauroyltransferase
MAARSPHRVLVWAALVGGYVHYRLSSDKRRNRRDNLSAVRPGPRVPPWRAFQSQALNVLELLGAARGNGVGLVRSVALRGEEHIRSALSGGKGVILATFHSGNWELAGLALALRGYPVTTIAGEQLRREWSDEVKALKERYGIRMISPGGALRLLYGDLRSNRAVVLHIDGGLFSGGHDVSFLGNTVKAPRGPAHLSRSLGCPVAFAYCRRTRRNRLEVFIEPPAAPPESAAEEHALTQSLVHRVEECILEDPGQWCIFRRISNTVEPN